MLHTSRWGTGRGTRNARILLCTHHVSPGPATLRPCPCRSLCSAALHAQRSLKLGSRGPGAHGLFMTCSPPRPLKERFQHGTQTEVTAANFLAVALLLITTHGSCSMSAALKSCKLLPSHCFPRAVPHLLKLESLCGGKSALGPARIRCRISGSTM